MRQGQNPKRSRGRGNNNRRNVPARHQTFDSNGPNVRIRGNAFQVHEKYLALARDANASGDRIAAENYMQHADHYFRIINVDNDDDAHGRTRHQGQRHDGRAGNSRESDEGFDHAPDAVESGHSKTDDGATQPAAAESRPADPDVASANGAVEVPPGLGEQPDVPPAPKRRGRPPRAARPNGADEHTGGAEAAEPDAPKPRRGRPRKNPLPASGAQPEE